MLEYYRLRQSQYERLIGYLRQRRVEVNNALVSLGGKIWRRDVWSANLGMF